VSREVRKLGKLRKGIWETLEIKMWPGKERPWLRSTPVQIEQARNNFDQGLEADNGLLCAHAV
jgi:hypothetical protein